MLSTSWVIFEILKVISCATSSKLSFSSALSFSQPTGKQNWTGYSVGIKGLHNFGPVNNFDQVSKVLSSELFQKNSFNFYAFQDPYCPNWSKGYVPEKNPSDSGKCLEWSFQIFPAEFDLLDYYKDLINTTLKLIERKENSQAKNQIIQWGFKRIGDNLKFSVWTSQPNVIDIFEKIGKSCKSCKSDLSDSKVFFLDKHINFIKMQHSNQKFNLNRKWKGYLVEGESFKELGSLKNCNQTINVLDSGILDSQNSQFYAFREPFSPDWLKSYKMNGEREITGVVLSWWFSIYNSDSDNFSFTDYFKNIVFSVIKIIAEKEEENPKDEIIQWGFQRKDGGLIFSIWTLNENFEDISSKFQFSRKCLIFSLRIFFQKLMNHQRYQNDRNLTMMADSNALDEKYYKSSSNVNELYSNKMYRPKNRKNLEMMESNEQNNDFSEKKGECNSDNSKNSESKKSESKNSESKNSESKNSESKKSESKNSESSSNNDNERMSQDDKLFAIERGDFIKFIFFNAIEDD